MSAVGVPEGVPGELWVSRFGLARGYHRLPDADRRTLPPGSARPGERALPDGRPGADGEPDDARVSRPHRSSVEDCRLPRRAGRSRSRSCSRCRSIEQCAVIAPRPAGRRGRDTARAGRLLRAMRTARRTILACIVRRRGRLQRVPVVRRHQGPRARVLQDDGRAAGGVRAVGARRRRSQLRLSSCSTAAARTAPTRSAGWSRWGSRSTPSRSTTASSRATARRTTSARSPPRLGVPIEFATHAGDGGHLPRQPGALLERLQRLLQDDLHAGHAARARARHPDRRHRPVSRADVRDPAVGRRFADGRRDAERHRRGGAGGAQGVSPHARRGRRRRSTSARSRRTRSSSRCRSSISIATATSGWTRCSRTWRARCPGCGRRIRDVRPTA